MRLGWHIAVLHVLAEIALSPPLISRHARARTHTHTHTQTRQRRGERDTRECGGDLCGSRQQGRLPTGRGATGVGCLLPAHVCSAGAHQR